MDVRISIIGLGKLGLPMVGVFAEKGFQVIGVDINKEFVRLINEGAAPVPEPDLQELLTANRTRIRATVDAREAVLHSDVSFVIVPTPSGEDKFFRNDFVVSALHAIGSALREKAEYHNVVVTSTVMPGSTGGVLRRALENASGKTVGPDLGLCYNPEFIALGSVVHDMLNPDMILIGQSDERAGEMLERIYRKSTESNPEIHRMNWVNAELCKLGVNTYVTTKISYANMIAEMCDHLVDADANVVLSALGADSRIGRKYLKGAVAYGGPCFPRDNKAFAALGRKLGVRSDLAEATDRINEHQTARLLGAVEAFAAPGSKVAVLGLSYKPNTPVIEESQGLALAEKLAAGGYAVSLSDPQALVSLPAGLPSGVTVAGSLSEAVREAQVIAVLTPWEDYKHLGKVLAAADAHPAAVVDPWGVVHDTGFLRSETRIVRLGVGNWLMRS